METSITHTSDQKQKHIFRKIIGESGNNPKVNFFGLMSFRITGTIFFVTAIFSWLAILYNDNLFLKWQLDSAGFGNAIDYFKFPIGILAASVPIVALFATNHRSQQAKAAMLISESQNRFANYYKHLEEFLKYTDSTAVKELISTNLDYRKAHAYIFSEAKAGNYSPSSKAQENLELLTKEIRYFLAQLDRNTNKLEQSSAAQIAELIRVYVFTHPYLGISIGPIIEAIKKITRGSSSDDFAPTLVNILNLFLEEIINPFRVLAEFDTEFALKKSFIYDLSDIKKYRHIMDRNR